MTNVFLNDEPAHKQYGFGGLWIGEEMELDLDELGVRAVTLRTHIHAHAAYHNKKFKTKTKGSTMYIKRVY